MSNVIKFKKNHQKRNIKEKRCARQVFINGKSIKIISLIANWENWSPVTFANAVEK